MGHSLAETDDALGTIAVEFERGIVLLRAQRPILGCPLTNLAQEMNPLDVGFRGRTTRVFEMWRESYAQSLRRAQHQGSVAADLHVGEAAYSLVAQIQGTLSLARNCQDPDALAAAMITRE